MLLHILVFICTIIVGFFIVRDFWLYTKIEYKLHKQFPAEKCHFIFGTILKNICCNQEEVFLRLRYEALKFKKSYSHWISGRLAVNIIRARDAELILSSQKCTNKSFVYDFLHPFMGTGLLTSNGKKWQQRRKILTPAFHFNILHHQFHKIFQKETNNFIQNIQTNKTHVVVLQNELSKFTLNTICETAMGVEVNMLEEPNEYRKKLHDIGELFLHRLLRPWLHSDFGCKLFGFKAKMEKMLIPIHNFTKSVIKERRQLFQDNKITTELLENENIYETKKTRYAMLDTLLVAAATREAIDDQGIREEVDTFMFEGHDTTSSALTFILFCLAENPDIQNKLYEEIKQLSKELSREEFTMHELNQLNYMDRVIKESLRLFPPVAFISREISETVEFTNNITLPKRTIIHFHIFDLHRDPEFFPDPEKYDPDRFLTDNIGKRHPFAYVPFSAGPRNCIGQKFALLEIKTLITQIILNFQLEQITKREEIIFIADLVLRTRKPILVKFKLRDK